MQEKNYENIESEIFNTAAETSSQKHLLQQFSNKVKIIVNVVLLVHRWN